MGQGIPKGIKDGTADALKKEKSGKKARDLEKNKNKNTWRQPGANHLNL
jgi:hypothetical protein